MFRVTVVGEPFKGRGGVEDLFHRTVGTSIYDFKNLGVIGATSEVQTVYVYYCLNFVCELSYRYEWT